MAKRVQIQSWRKPGGKKPSNVVVVARPSKWGNPYRIGDPTVPDAREAVARFRLWHTFPDTNAPDPSELRGKDLACYCPLDAPCHADVLLELANKDDPQP